MGLAGLGALAGLGRGVANVGAGMARDASLEEQRQAQLEREQRAEQYRIDRENRTQEAAIAKEERAAAAKAASAPQGALQLANNPEMLAAASGGTLSRQEAEIFADLNKNGRGQTVPIEDGGGGGGTMPKYEPGMEAEVAKRGTEALFSAMKLTHPDKADDLANSQLTDYKRGAATRAEAGDSQAQVGALAAHGHGEFDAGGSSKATGVPAKGSLDDAKVGTEKASAVEKRAQAGKHSADAEKALSEAKGDLSKENSKIRLNQMLDSLNNTAKDMSLDQAFLAQVNEARKRLVTRISELTNDTGSSAGAKPESKGKGISKAEYAKLPPGAEYTGPDGKTYRKK